MIRKIFTNGAKERFIGTEKDDGGFKETKTSRGFRTGANNDTDGDFTKMAKDDMMTDANLAIKDFSSFRTTKDENFHH